MAKLAVQIGTRCHGVGTTKWPSGDAGEEWDGVRNYQARNNMRLMNGSG